MIKEIYFNELSKQGFNTWSDHDLEDLGGVFSSLKRFGISTCRISAEDLGSLLLNLPKGRMGNNARILLYTMFKPPYESPGVEARQDEYYIHKWKCRGRECLGLALASITDSLTYSLNSEEWNKPEVEICCDDELMVVRNVSNAYHVQHHSSWLEAQMDTVLIESKFKPYEKTINLRDDHGKDKLEEFAKRLINCPYVDKVINSLAFKPWTNRFLGDIKANGIVELILVWEDNRCGLAVQTTGRNFHETQKIAEILQEKYGHR